MNKGANLSYPLCLSWVTSLFSPEELGSASHWPQPRPSSDESPAPVLVCHLCSRVTCARVSPVCVTGPVPLREAGWEEGRPWAKLRTFPSLRGNRVAVPVASLILAREWNQLFLESFLAPISMSVLKG